MLSRTGEYALRAVLLLGSQPESELMTAESIAAALGLPANYLAKTLNRLARRGIVVSVRGRRGGFRLARAPRELRVVDVVSDFEERADDGQCALGGRCDPSAPCVAHEQWQRLSTQRVRLGETTVAAFLDAGDSDAARMWVKRADGAGEDDGESSARTVNRRERRK